MTDVRMLPETEHAMPTIERPRLSNWIWRPWYAKLWWSLIAVYWTGAVGALLFGLFRDLYGSSLAGYLNVAFYPVFALFILSVGWMIAWKDALDFVAEHPEIENPLGWHWSTEPYDFFRERSRRLNDTTDPASPAYISPTIH